VLEVLLGVGAIAGGLALMLGPRGEIMPLPLSALEGSPFDTYLVPGLILFGVLGLGSLAAALLVWLRHPLAPVSAIVVGVVLLIWIAVEIAIIGYRQRSTAPADLSAPRSRDHRRWTGLAARDRSFGVAPRVTAR